MIKVILRKIIRLFQIIFNLRQPSAMTLELPNHQNQYRIFVVGVVMANKENYFDHISQVMANSNHLVDQYWISIFGYVSTNVSHVTIEHLASPKPRNKIINYVINKIDISKYDYIIICDDDIKLPNDFVDKFIYLQDKLNFSIAQPARTNLSYVSHRITRRRYWLVARKTLFVEIGPLVSFRKDIFEAIFPFDETSEMGWGLDLVWPKIIQTLNKSMGIIDATPVDHSLRGTAKSYSLEKARTNAADYLSNVTHLPESEAHVNLRSYTVKDLPKVIS